MNEKKRDLLFTSLIVLLLVAGNIYLFYNNNFKSEFSGMAINEIPTFFERLDFSRIAFIVQWVLIILIVILAYIRHLRRRKHQDIKVSFKSIERGQGKSSTDIDSLYSLLKDKKHLNISSISKIFKIDKEKAFEWCKMLEDYNLAVINYPAFSDPEIEIKEKIEEGKEEIKKQEIKKEEKEVEEKHGEKTERKVFAEKEHKPRSREEKHKPTRKEKHKSNRKVFTGEKHKQRREEKKHKKGRREKHKKRRKKRT